MVFTIQVSKSVDPDFNATQLEMRHGECGGGKLSRSEQYGGWHLTCSRCHVEATVRKSNSGSAAIAMTALDGKPRVIVARSEASYGISVEQCP
jgi:hypothetical protein